MRVIYLHQYFTTPDMAGGTRSYEMARRLVAAGHQVHMVTTWREPSAHTDWFVTDEAGVTVHWLPLPYSNHMSAAQRIRAFLKFAWASSRKAAALAGDVVFATSTPLTIAIPGIYASWRRKIPMVFEVRDLWPDALIEMGLITNPIAIRMAKTLERLAYRRATRIVVLAPGMKDALCRQGVADAKVDVITNGCDFDVFSSRGLDPVVFPAAVAGATSIAYIGTMGLVNGVEYVPRLAAEIQRRAGPDAVRFYMIGDGGRRPQVEALARELGVLGTSVHFIGLLPKRETARWVAAADATIITYDGPDIVFRDSVSNKFFDSIAAGKPVLANFAGFSTRLAAEAGGGFILSRDPATAAAELLDIVSDRTALARAGQAALRLAQERFSRDRLASGLEHVLRDAVSCG